MCGRFVITSAPEALRRLFGYAEQPNFPPRYNVAPTQPIPVVTKEQGLRNFRLMRWGLIPAWVKGPRQFALLINARSETVLEKPAFKNAIRRRRCLIPADGYYEWQQLQGRKQPMFVHRSDHAPFAFAAVMETWLGPNGEEVDTVAIVTTAADGDMNSLHERVPVTISEGDYERWLDCSDDNAESAIPLMQPPAQGEFAWHPVSTRVNKTENDDETLLALLSEEEIAAELAAKSVKPPRKKTTAAPKDEGQGSLF